MSGLADSVIARILKQRDLLQAMNDECKSISVEMVSQNQAVKVKVNASGAMLGLWLSSQAQRMPADELAKLIVETAQAALRVSLERQQFLSAEFNKRFQELRHQPLTKWDGSTFTPDPS
ncbi:YbaB/EbfC family nucleoid-associated protein [Mycobacteroides sp. LB1]|uniref:YbaB/EbfC family nucleoid-associated protein n=1 Tax=Mycobacteroides sp. LB1 TaxID=2750814 RepID=UPI001C60196C